jgi:hypothetical protein
MGWGVAQPAQPTWLRLCCPGNGDIVHQGEVDLDQEFQAASTTVLWLCGPVYFFFNALLTASKTKAQKSNIPSKATQLADCRIRIWI